MKRENEKTAAFAKKLAGENEKFLNTIIAQLEEEKPEMLNYDTVTINWFNTVGSDQCLEISSEEESRCIRKVWSEFESRLKDYMSVHMYAMKRVKCCNQFVRMNEEEENALDGIGEYRW